MPETTAATTAATTATPATRAPDGRVGAPPPHAERRLEPLDLALAPVSLETFRGEHWERRPLHVPRAEPGRFDSVLSAADVERLVCTTAIRAPAFRLVKDGGQLPLSDYTETIPWRPSGFTQTAVVERVASEFERGATIVLQGLHHHWHPTALFCRGLEARLGCPVQANAYFTPAAAQGFAVHHDTHDVFVLQVAGRKRWRIYEPLLELPLKTQRWSPDLGEVGDPVADLVLADGDTLYLPRGWPHEAFTSDADSLHLTIGLHPPSRLDALRAALDSCADDLEFRRSVDLDGVLPDGLLERLGERLDPQAVGRRMRRSLAARRRPILDGQLTQVAAANQLTAHDEIELRPTVLVTLELDDRGAALLFDRKEIRFPPKARAAVEALVDADGPLTAAQLPGPLDTDGRLVLLRRLVREGLLRVRGGQAQDA